MRVMWIVGTVAAALSAGSVCGQDYPNRPLRILTSEAGGGNDFVARILSQGMSGPLGQNIIVDNRGGVIPGTVVAQATPDGYNLIVAGSSFWTGPLFQKTPYDPLRDFSPISMATVAPNVLVVHPSLPVNSVQELIALAKAKPGTLNYATGVIGTGAHLAGELLKSMAHVDIVHIPYKGNAPALNDLIGGQVQMMFTIAFAAMPHVKAGRLKALAVTSAQPSPLIPGLPTVASAGLPGYESVVIVGMFAPAKTPGPIVNRLNQEMVRFLNQPDVKERVLGTGAVVTTTTPAEFANTIKAEVVRLSKVMKEAGIRPTQ